MTKGFLERKIQGQIPVSNSAHSHTHFEKNNPKDLKKKSNKDDRATIKLPQDIKRQLNIVKQTEQFNYDYEVIQYLIYVYIEHLSPEDRKRFNILKDFLG